MSGFTNIPNALFDWMIDNKELSNQTRIMAMVIRYTVCFNRQFHNLSLSFFAQRLDMKRQNINRDIQTMIDSGLIREERKGQNRLLGIGLSVIKNDDSLIESVIKSDDSTVIKNDDRSVINFDDQESKQTKVKNNKVVHDDLFNQFWIAYPRKEGKADAQKAFETAIKKDSIDQIILGCKGYTKVIQKENRETKYIKLPAGWLRSELWRDYINQATQQESTILRLIANQQAEIDGETDERLQRIFNERRKQAGRV